MGTDGKIKIIKNNGEIEIIGNREGLQWLAEICLSMSEKGDALK